MTFVRRAAGSTWVRAAASVVLLGIVLLQIDLGEAVDRLQDGEWGWFVAAVGALLVALLIGAWRWHVLLEGAGVESSGFETLRAFAIGVFSNNFLPTSFGGDAVRAWIVGRPQGTTARAMTSVGVDRVTALACLVGLGWLLAATDPDAVEPEHALALLVASLGGLVAVGGLLVGFLRGSSPRWFPTRVSEWGREGRDVIQAYLRSPRVGWVVLGLGLVYQLMGVACVWCITRVVGVDLSLATIGVALPLILLANLFPFSVAGFGVRESAYVVVLGGAGVDATDATLISLLVVTATAISSLPGGIAMIMPGAPSRTAEQPE